MQADCGVKVAIGTRNPTTQQSFYFKERTLINKDCFFCILDPN
jgi:hypothetical protein